MTACSSLPVTASGRIRSASTEGGAWVGEYDLHPGYQMGAHTHRHRGLAIGLAGTYVARIGRRQHALGPGQVLVFPDGARHHEQAGTCGSRCLLLLFGDDFHDRSLDEVFTRDRIVPAPGALDLGSRLAAELGADDPATSIALDALVGELMTGLGTTLGLTTQARAPTWIDTLREELDARYLCPPSLTELAQTYGRSREHLARSFRRHFGVSIGEYLRGRRIDHAARQLASTDRSVAALATEAGFADQSHLTRWFRRRYRVTPDRYRRRRRPQ